MRIAFKLYVMLLRHYEYLKHFVLQKWANFPQDFMKTINLYAILISSNSNEVINNSN